MNKSESKYFHTARRMDEALLELLLEKDFAYITVKELCHRAGVNRSTFYLHYENTTDLLAEAMELVQEQLQPIYPQAEDGIDGIETAPREALFFMTDQYLLPYLECIRQNKHVYKAVHTQLGTFGAERAYRQFFDTVFSPILSRFGVAPEFHEYVMEFYRHGLVAVLMKWVESDCALSTQEVADMIKLCTEAKK